MRTLIAGIAVLLIVTLDTSAQDSNAQIKAAVRDVLVRQQDAWNRHDLLRRECDYRLARYP